MDEGTDGQGEKKHRDEWLERKIYPKTHERDSLSKR